MIESQGVRILLVEDDEFDRMAVERLFAEESLPYDLVVATTVAEATSRLREGGIALVLIDHKLPDGSGLDVQKEAAGTPSIFITAADDLSVAVKAKKAGAADFLVKDDARQYLQLLPLAIASTLKQQENVRARRRAEEALHRAQDELEANVRQRTAELTSTVDRLSEEIGQRKQVEEALRESEQKHRALIENASDAIFVVDGKGQYVEANKKACQMLGYSEEEFLSFDIRDIAAPDQLDVVLGYFDELLQRGRMSRTFDVIAKGGRRLALELNAVRLANGTYLGIGRDVTRRRQAEEELRQFKSIVSNSNDMLALLDKSFVYLAANEAYLKAFGKTSDELIGHTVSEIFGEEFFEKTIRPNAERCLAGEEVHYQSWIDFPLLGRQYRDAAYFPFLGLDKEVEGFVVRSQDITERKQAEEALRESEERFDLAVRATSDGIWDWDVLTNESRYAPRTWEILGYSLDDPELPPAYDAWASQIHPDDCDQVMNALKGHFEEGKIYDVDYRHRHQSGEYRWQNSRGQAIFDEQGKPVRMVGCIRDITERKRAEEIISESEQRFRDFFEKTPIGLHIFAPDQIIIDINDAELEMIGYRREEIVGKKTWQDIVIPAQRESFQEHWQEITTKGQIRDIEYTLVHKRGYHIDVILNASSRFNENGNLINTRGSVLNITERKRAEEALRESEQRFDLAVRATSDGIWEWDILTDEEYFSPAWCEILGYSHDDPELQHTYDSWASRIHPDDYDHVMNAEKGHLEEGKVYDVDYRHRHQSGEYRWQNSRGQAIFDEYGKPVRMVGCIRDITERKRAEEELRKSNANLEAGQAIAHVGSYDWEIATGGVTWSDEMFRIYGLEKRGEAISFDAVMELTHPADVPRIMERVKRMLQGEVQPPIEYRAVRPDGTERILAGDGIVVFDQSGKPVRMIGTVQDVTERKRAQEELQQNTERARLLAKMLDTSSQPFAMGSADGRLIRVNPAFCELTGYSEEELLKDVTWDETLTPPEWRELEARVLDTLMRSGKPQRFEKEYIRKDGKRRNVELLLHRNLDTQGRFESAFAFVTDVTERKRAEKSLRESEEALQKAHDELEERVGARTAALASVNEQLYREMKERERTEEALYRSQRLASMGTMAAGIAHEINNPLHGIALASEIALQQKDGPQGSQTVDEMLRKIQGEALRCGRITQGVLQFARQETSEKWPGSLADVVRRAKDLTRQPAADKQVGVRLELSDSLPPLTINPTEMEQVFVNLICNAIEASEPGDCVTVRADVVPDAVRVLVEDRGCGMTKEQTDQVFDPFYTTRQEAGGTGLGLSVTHGIIEGHGGTIRAESSPGHGSAFTLVLPLQLPTTKGAENGENPDC